MSIHFEWTEDMSVGEKTIDAQHQRLLAQVNTLIDAMFFGKMSAEVTEALSFFETYINEHLAYEEAYMQERGFSDLEEHKRKHEVFRDKYKNFKSKMASDAIPDAALIEMEGFLGQWWVDHIGHEDRKYFLEFGSTST